ncbi:helix-turn-helix transcriptional regulator [Pseudalkalibacillus sp. NRS-1564]|uniref:helix-turn-helix transcriptional regulator n=1 Tax=Pseudalkalibacillus sp. NRS-1564 TaxID=3233900 RepID=UPI003D2909E8
MNTRMKELRAALKLTQADLAKRVNVRRETIVFLEKGEYNPSLKLAVKIARQLNSRIEDVFILDEDDLR